MYWGNPIVEWRQKWDITLNRDSQTVRPRFPHISKKALEVTFENNDRMKTASGRWTVQVVQKGQLANSQISSLNNESLTQGTKIEERGGK